MNTGTKLFLLLILCFTLIGCGGNNTAINSAVVNGNSAANGNPPVNSYVASNGETMQPAFNNATNQIGSNLPASANADIVTADNKATAKQPEVVPAEMPAPDNSTYSAEMNASGQPVETRTFKSHPTLAKIQKITLSPRDYVFKIYFKNGKTVESKSEELKQFRFIAPENILDAIDMLPKATPDPNDPTKDGKKKPAMIPLANP